MSANTEMNDLKEKCAVMDCGTGEIREGLPMFLQDDGEKKLNELRKELEVYVKLLKTSPLCVFTKTKTIMSYSMEEEVIDAWWKNPNTKNAMNAWIHTNNHKVNGKFGNWSSGCLGNRWADCEINGKNCRIAFYSRKGDPHKFHEDAYNFLEDSAETMGVLDGNNYILDIQKVWRKKC
jgi:hypothetical protein